ncbi:DNA-directed RNA polymerase III subunit RPC9 isoform X3 [Numida meleagris]|uniref:DNA-directed RNA polymerase III subunit RPC9 isoform X3 n=1 Tax=Numida meleagris TaxID=8996 RepID=UPI000B3E31B2|nr:DNA-directed RNA polymerase III subunit RPC9 isoform X3 [Numida meleagris]
MSVMALFFEDLAAALIGISQRASLEVSCPRKVGTWERTYMAARSTRVLMSCSRKDANAALLSNFEVFQLLTDLKQQRKESGKNKQSSGQQNLNTIMYETLKYISKTPCRYQSPETVREFLIAMKSHKLTKAEKLQLLNHRPVTAVEIQLMVEESEERLTEEQIESLLQTVSSILPGDPEEQQRDSAMETEDRGGQ